MEPKITKQNYVSCYVIQLVDFYDHDTPYNTINNNLVEIM